MNEREQIIQLWFENVAYTTGILVWMTFCGRRDYTESWSPKYNNRQVVKHWFQEWNTRAKSLLGKSNNFSTKEIRRLWSGISKMK